LVELFSNVWKGLRRFFQPLEKRVKKLPIIGKIGGSTAA
jgi:hypothetical protein